MSPLRDNEYINPNLSKSHGKVPKKLRRSHQGRSSAVKHLNGENAAHNLSISRDLEGRDEDSNFDFHGMHAAQIDSLPVDGLHGSISQPHTLREECGNRRLSEVGQLAGNAAHPYGNQYNKGRKSCSNGYSTIKGPRSSALKGEAPNSDGHSNIEQE